MFGLFKKNIKKEFWKRIEESRKSYDFVQNNNPFEVAPAKYEKHSRILEENRKWFKDNSEELMKHLNDEQQQFLLEIINA